VAGNLDALGSGYESGKIEDQVSEAIVLVGSMPCPIREERYDGDSSRWVAGGPSVQCNQPEEKRPRILSSSGQEIVGTSYSAGPAIETLTREDQQKQQQITQDVQGTEMPKDNMTGTRKTPQPRWCPVGLTKTQRRRLQKLRKAEIEREKAEIERDEWFN
jgi:hypothetical protein